MSRITEVLEAAGLDHGKAAEAERSILEGYRSKEETDKAKARVEELEAQNAELASKVKGLTDSDETEALKAKIAEFEKADGERRAKDAEDKAKAEFKEAFDKAVGERKFANSFTAKAVFSEAWEKHRQFPETSTDEIVGQLTSGDGVFAAAQRDPARQPVPRGAESGEKGVPGSQEEFLSRLFATSK